MGLLSPWFLAGLAAIGLPVWLHLLRKHRSTPLPFSSLRFFERRIQSSIKHRRLQYLLLLALRMALLALLVLAFAKPYLKHGGGAAAGGRKLVVLAVDDSFSMRQGGRLESAREQAAQLAGRLAPGDSGQVVAFDSGVRTMSDATADPTALRAGIRVLEAGDARGSYAELARALRGMAQTARVPVEAHVFSDMQKSSLPPNFADLALDGGIRLVPHPVVNAAAANFTVESVRAPRRVYDQRKVHVEATVAGFGTAAAARRAALYLNGREIESHSVDVPAGGRATLEFTALEVPYGMNRCEIRIEPADSLPQDDRFYFSIERADPRPVLFVHEPGNTRALVYFRTALESAAQAAFQLEPAGADQTAHVNPARYAFVVLSDVASIPPAFEAALKEYVRGGGAVWVALGRMGGLRGRVPVSGDAVGEARYFGREGERFQTAAWLDAGHPAVARTGRWDDVRFFQAARVDPGAARVVARFADGTPLLLDHASGEGRVLVFASTLDNIGNDLPLHPAFVPFVERTSRYLGRLDDGPAGYTVDAYFDLRSGGEAGAAAEVLGPDGKRALTLDEATRTRSFRLVRAGFYDIKHPDGRRELVAVNTDRRESDLEVIPAETLALWSGGGGTGAGAGGAGEEPRPVPLWWYAMLAALVLAAAESWWGNRHFSIGREPEKQTARKEAA